VSSQILFHEADIIGIQEALHSQVLDLQKALPAFKFTGVGRTDGKQDGEYSAIFYNAKKLQLLESKTFWLSETPTVVGSKSWDAAITRIVTCAKFKDTKTNKTFFVFNTHFDHIGKVARRESAKLLLKKINEIANKSSVIITRDFNATPGDEPVQVLVNANDPLKIIDTKSISQQPHYGPTGTFNAFGSKETNDEPIDYIFIKNGFKVLKHQPYHKPGKAAFHLTIFQCSLRLLFSKI
jgi:endonuclease/exonuclease/phosphatase family metal-dependent hydrolase